MKRQSLHVKDSVTYDQFTKQQVIWTHGYGATDRYVTRNEWGALLLQWPVPVWTRAPRLCSSGWYIPVWTRAPRLCSSGWPTRRPAAPPQPRRERRRCAAAGHTVAAGSDGAAPSAPGACAVPDSSPRWNSTAAGVTDGLQGEVKTDWIDT